jgi:hypothetical protein
LIKKFGDFSLNHLAAMSMKQNGPKTQKLAMLNTSRRFLQENGHEFPGFQELEKMVEEAKEQKKLMITLNK